MNKNTDREKQRITLLGSGLKSEEAFYLEVLTDPSLSVKVKVYWLFNAFRMYIRYAEGEKALAIARRLLTFPARYRSEYDYLVAQDLGGLPGQEIAAARYLDSVLSGKPKQTVLNARRGIRDLALLRDSLLASSPEVDAVAQEESLKATRIFYAFAPQVEPFLRLLRTQEDRVVGYPIISEWALLHVASLLQIKKMSGVSGLDGDIDLVDSALQRVRLSRPKLT